MLKHAINISYYYSDFTSIQVYTSAARIPQDLKSDFSSKKEKKKTHIQTPGYFLARESHIKVRILKAPIFTSR